MEYQLGMIVSMKKGHPCGSNEWEIIRVGADFKIKCKGCDHIVMMPRKNVEKSIKKVLEEKQ